MDIRKFFSSKQAPQAAAVSAADNNVITSSEEMDDVSETETGDFVLSGMEMGLIPVRRLTIVLDCELVRGIVSIGVRPALPIDGEEISRQCRLVDTVLKPQLKLHRTELPLQLVYKEEEVVSEQQLCIQEKNYSVNQENPEPPQIKEKQEKLCSSEEQNYNVNSTTNTMDR
ncbi:hypothetical protein NQZ68_002356 [Dissostichus eleginoides]|nr:hypothetical protein NQZ68_002356 [Dissostichus eleginoides]